MSLPVVAPGEQVIELMIPASKVGLIIGKCRWSLFQTPDRKNVEVILLYLASSSLVGTT